MSTVFMVMAVIAMIAVLGSLFVGIFGMVQGGEFNRKHGNRMMRARVMLQAVAVILLAAAFMVG